MKHRISIDLEKDVYLSIAMKALHNNTKIKNYIENNMSNWLRSTRKKVEAKAQKEVSAATDHNEAEKPAIKIVITEKGQSLYYLNGKRISKAAAEQILY